MVNQAITLENHCSGLMKEYQSYKQINGVFKYYVKVRSREKKQLALADKKRGWLFNPNKIGVKQR